MKRFLSVLLVLTLLVGSMLMPVSASAATNKIRSTSYSEQFTFTYKYGNDNAVAASRQFRVFIKNGNSKSITKYQVGIRFYDSYGNYLTFKSSSWVKTTLGANKGAWSPFITAPAGTSYFTWRLAYCLKGSSKVLYSPFMRVATPKSSVSKRSHFKQENQLLEEESGLAARYVSFDQTSYQRKHLFNISSSTGSVYGYNQYFRTFIKNLGTTTLRKYQLSLYCYDDDGYRVGTIYTGRKSMTLKRGSGIWSIWVGVPTSTDSFYSYVTVYY